jgi:hypothetical protein
MAVQAAALAAIKSSIRASTPADGPAIGALFTERGMRHNLDSRYLDWKYWQPRDDWSEPRSFVLFRGITLQWRPGPVRGKGNG